jgi:hypothetical protein
MKRELDEERKTSSLTIFLYCVPVVLACLLGFTIQQGGNIFIVLVELVILVAVGFAVYRAFQKDRSS